MSDRMTLFRFNWAGSAVAEAVAAQAGLPLTLVDVHLEGGAVTADDRIRTRNPANQVPVLELADGTIVTESAAIALYLAELAPEAGLMPPPGTPASGIALRWLFYLAVNGYEPVLRAYYPDRYTADPAGRDGVRDAANARLDQTWADFAGAITGPFLLGDRPCVTDLYAKLLSDWGNGTGDLQRRHPRLRELSVALARTWPAAAKVLDEQRDRAAA